ncbi:hypothetical protein OTERR_03770 [Oryzomicrobium terrae]|uniref:YXWGXW repeat-containing protein n=1 Tax=Oryzomicrobium terrae TaxID=1735038 RepID=A0A5C1E4R2_9RHOO|nr:YXWGXW repeat-containing protein [Oryzomicrobium terrae]QEL63853.1 hypothetical protein OTERR_03770 [Oryzomicrobium terrae]
MRTKLLLVALTAAAALSGCVVAPAGRPYYGGPVYSEPVMVAPPPPRVEYVGPPPVVGQVWIGGFWNWTGQRHDWVPGHWENPRPGYTWTPHRWERAGDGWRHAGGHWEEDRGRGERRDWR